MRTTSLLSALILLGTGAEAHGQAHVHGQAEASLTIGRDGALQVELIAPAGDIVGFEHAPRSEAEHRALRRLEEQLADPLVSVPSRAGCSLAHAEISGPGAEDSRHHDHAGHDHAQGHETAHHHPHHESDQADHEHEHEHGHFDAADAQADASHGNMTVQWRFDCTRPEAIRHAEFGAVFEAFPAIERIEVSALLGSRPPGFGLLTPQRSRLDLP